MKRSETKSNQADEFPDSSAMTANFYVRDKTLWWLKLVSKVVDIDPLSRFCPTLKIVLD